MSELLSVHPKVITRTIGEVTLLKFGERITKSSSTGGEFPVYGGGGQSFTHSVANREDDIVVSRFALSQSCVRRVKGPFWLLDSGLTLELRDKRLDKDYLAHFLLQNQHKIFACASGAAQKNLSSEAFRNIEVPIPHLEIQREIVRILDTFTQLEAELEAELEARRRQFLFLESKIIGDGTVGATWGKLGDVAFISTGSKPKEKESGAIGLFPYMNGGTRESGYVSSANSEGEAITVPARGSVGFVNFQDEPFWFGPLCYRIIPKHDEALDVRFLYLWLKFKQNEIVARQNTGSIPALNLRDLAKQPVPLLEIARQKEIIRILWPLRELITSPNFGLPAEISARRKQYECYRQQLLTFDELVQA